MAKYTKESIQKLRDAVDIVDVISRSVSLKKSSGATMKGLCPFHAEKSPSFQVNRASKHYHCFGCGAHGDVVSFLMQQEAMTFTQAILFLSERFQVSLQEDHLQGSLQASEDIKKAKLKALLEKATRFFHGVLLFSQEAERAREYLRHRGFSLEFISAFLIGYNPIASRRGAISPLMKYLFSQGYTEQDMLHAGLLSKSQEGERVFDFFAGRITFPIVDHLGSTIGFSARKLDEETFGGKYINTPETFLFKKSRIFFGLPYSKRRIIKERNLILVEGQLDALRLIFEGFDYTVATLGTAFSQAHVDLLKPLGVEAVYIAFDSDQAGVTSAIKAGDLLMKNGISVFHVQMRGVKDPDECIVTYGRAVFFDVLLQATEHIHFIVELAQKSADWSSAREKEKSVRLIVEQIQGWENPLLIHEALVQLSKLALVPLELLKGSQEPSISRKKVTNSEKDVAISFGSHQKISKNISNEMGVIGQIDSETELELDLVRWGMLLDSSMKQIIPLMFSTIAPDEFFTEIGRKMYSAFMALYQRQSPENIAEITVMDLASELNCDPVEEAYIQYMIHKPPLAKEKIAGHIREAIRKLKEKKWLLTREAIRKEMIDQRETMSESEQMRFIEKFSSLKPPVIPSFEGA